MEEIIKYFRSEIEEYSSKLKSADEDIRRKQIKLQETGKAISKLTDVENNTYNIFNASGKSAEFNDKEVVYLKQQEKLLDEQICKALEEKKKIQEKLELLKVLLVKAEDVRGKIHGSI